MNHWRGTARPRSRSLRPAIFAIASRFADWVWHFALWRKLSIKLFAIVKKNLYIVLLRICVETSWGCLQYAKPEITLVCIH